MRRWWPLASVLIGASLLSLQASIEPDFALATVGLILLIAPCGWLLGSRKGERRPLMLVLCSAIAILCVRYLFAFQFPYLVGTDAPAHFDQVNGILRDGRIDLTATQGASFDYPHLYLLYATLTQILGTDLAPLTVWLAPSINAISVLFFHLFARRIVGARAAVVATLLFALEYFSFFFGFEFRTQSYALVFLLGVLWLVMKRRSSFAQSVCTILLLASLVTSHVVTAVQGIATLFLLVAASIAVRALPARWRREEERTRSATVAVLSAVVFVTYIAFTTPTIESMLPYLVSRISDALAGDLAWRANLQGIAVAGYLPIVSVIQWITRIAFVLAIASFVVSNRTRWTTVSVFLVAMAGLYGVLLVGDTLTVGLLSSGRWGMYFDIPQSILLGWGLVRLAQHIRPRIRRPWISAAFAVVLVTYTFGSFAKYPVWVTGSQVGPTYRFSFHASDRALADAVSSSFDDADMSTTCASASAMWLLRSQGLTPSVAEADDAQEHCVRFVSLRGLMQGKASIYATQR